jgi:serine/threonine protein kinase
MSSQSSLTDRGAGSRPASALPVPLPEHIGKYTVQSRIGGGSMVVVYKCSQPGLDRPVAVKVMASPADARIERFQREARAAARLTHANVVQVYDVGSEGGLHYIVMEYVDGRSLDELIGTPVLTLEKTLGILFAVARALQSAHEQGIIHRDIKPSNILIHRSGQPKLADFGLAKSLDDVESLSGSGDLIGTPRYMSPEQVLEAPEGIDSRTDVYSLGAVMYEMLTGTPPVDGPNVLSILRRITDEQPVPVRERNPSVPPAIAGICARAMALDREARYPSAAALADAVQGHMLDRMLGKSDMDVTLPMLPGSRRRVPDLPRRARPWFRWLGGLLIISGFFIGGLLLLLRGGNNAAESVSATWLAQMREQVNEPLSPGSPIPPRDRWAAAIDGLTGQLAANRQNLECRRLRARAYERCGECLAAVEDWSQVLQQEPGDHGALTHRLLANYQVHVLYLGNIGEGALRSAGASHVRGDVKTLLDSEDATEKYIARLIDALGQQKYLEAAKVADTGRPVAVSSEYTPALAMLEADAWFHATDELFGAEAGAADEDRKAKRQQREDYARRALSVLRRGLDADPHHVGLLFLDASSILRRAVWDGLEGEDRAVLLRRHRLEFDEALDRLRLATLRRGCDTAVARAVLWDQFGRDGVALDHLHDALSCRPTVPDLHTFRTWLALHAPADERLTREEVQRLLRDLQPAFVTPPEIPNPYFVRALVLAAAGQWDEARLDLGRCRSLLGKAELQTTVAVYGQWYARSAASTTEYLDATQEVLANLPVPPSWRVRLGEEVLKRLGDGATIEQDKLTPDDIKTRKGWTHFRLARAFAENQERTNALKQIREALQLKLPDLKPQNFREDGAFSAWNEDPEFLKLYAEHEAKE